VGESVTDAPRSPARAVVPAADHAAARAAAAAAHADVAVYADVAADAQAAQAPDVAAVLAIDGGNTKTDVALIGADGSVLAAARGGASNHQMVGRAGALAVLTELVVQVAGRAGLPAGVAVASHTSACLAGADLPEEEAELSEVIADQGWSATSTVVNDTFAVLRAGLDDAGEPGSSQHWGIAVVCGAGLNCVGVAPDGRTTRFLALGQISGDWGGGGDLGPAALWWAIRAEDGRGPATELRTAVAAHFGVGKVADVVIRLHLGKISYARLHGLVPVLYEVAERGDEVANRIVLRLADEISTMAIVAATRLGLAGEAPVAPGGQPRSRVGAPVPVVLGGSLITARDPILTDAVGRKLSAGIPGADVRIVDVPPIAGAALLGLDQVGAGPATAARLRASATATW
jgi:N-acetylglucosamine kinase-like BadF-type ATPase